MNFSNAVNFLIENGCPSIVYRTKKEILGQTFSKDEYENYQNQIMQDEKVLYILSIQKEDGWIGKTFHGDDEPESGIRYLCEKGVDPQKKVIVDALNAIEVRGDKFDEGCLYRVGKLLDKQNLGGSKMIKACVYAYAGQDNTPFLTEQIGKALDAFKYVAHIKQIGEVFEEKDGKFIFQDGIQWPSIYHLRLLAFTYSWRNEENKKILVDGFRKLGYFGTIPDILLLCKGQIISPASFCMNDFEVDLSTIKDKEWMMWFHRMELIARLDIINDVSVLGRQIDELKKILEHEDGIYCRKLSHYYFKKWTPYLGLALENNWKKKNARACDLTFRCLLILKLSNKLHL